VNKLLKSVMNGQCNARPTVTFPAAEHCRHTSSTILLGDRLVTLAISSVATCVMVTANKEIRLGCQESFRLSAARNYVCQHWF